MGIPIFLEVTHKVAEILTDTANIVEEMNLTGIAKKWDEFLDSALDFLIHLVFTLIVYYIGKKIIKWLLILLQKVFIRAQLEQGVIGFLNSLAKAAMYLILFMIMAEVLGFKTTSLVALIGSAGLTIGLALQGSLSNFAGGVLILLLKPFRVGDYIVSDGNEGTVTAIDVFYTKLLTPDNKKVVLPNGTLSNSSIVNVTNEPARRMDLDIPVSYESDLKQIKELLLRLCEENSFILAGKKPEVFVSSFEDYAIILRVRVWVLKENYWELRAWLLEGMKYIFDKHGIKVPYRKLDIFLKVPENTQRND